LQIIAQKADGALRDALSIFDQIVSFAGTQFTYQDVIDNLNVLDYDYYFRLVDAALDGDTSSALLTFNEILDAGFDGHHFISGMGEHLRNLLVSKDEGTLDLLEVGENIRERYREQSDKCDLLFLSQALEVVSQADIHYKGSNNKRLHTEIALLQLCSVTANPADGVKKKSAS
jgi:DNA polymerase-3 subunit gamma/tau